MTPTEARDEAKRLLALVVQGKDPEQEKLERRKELTIGEHGSCPFAVYVRLRPFSGTGGLQSGQGIASSNERRRSAAEPRRVCVPEVRERNGCCQELLSGSRQIKAGVCEEESSQFEAHVRVDGGGDRVSGSDCRETVGTQATEYDSAIHARDGRLRPSSGGQNNAKDRRVAEYPRTMRQTGGREDVSAGDSSLQASSCKAGGISASDPLPKAEGGGVIRERQSPFGKGAKILP